MAPNELIARNMYLRMDFSTILIFTVIILKSCLNPNINQVTFTDPSNIVSVISFI